MTTAPADEARTAVRAALHLRGAVAHYRQMRGLTYRSLSSRLSGLGSPIAASALRRIELGERLVDVDELVLLAWALDVSPLELLTPVSAIPASESSGGTAASRLVGPATMAALLRANAAGDHEGVRIIVSTSDPAMLVDRLLEALLLLGTTRYGSREGMAAAMADLLAWLAVIAAGRAS